MDLAMPGMGGHEAARRMCELPGPAGAVPIVALTATAGPEDRARCMAVGMLDVLAKPVRPAELLAAVARFGAGAMAPPAASAASAAAATPPATAAEGPLLNLGRVDDLRRGLPLATLAPLVEECLADIRQRLPVLQAALEAGETQPIEQAAHALAGMAGNFGLSGLEARMRRIMTAMRTRDLATARAATDGVEGELRRSGEAIRLALRSAA
jgi:CheY-like chemotaxis protein